MEANNNFSFEVSKEFDVPVEELFKAWNSEDALKSWWKPMGAELTGLENDLRPGGKVRYSFNKADENQSFTVEGHYEEVKENELLVYSWNWQLPDLNQTESEYKLTISFDKAEKGSRIWVVQQSNQSEEALMPHKEGWDKALNGLADYIGGNAGGQAEIAGYNEAPEQQKVGE